MKGPGPAFMIRHLSPPCWICLFARPVLSVALHPTQPSSLRPTALEQLAEAHWRQLAANTVSVAGGGLPEWGPCVSSLPSHSITLSGVSGLRLVGHSCLCRCWRLSAPRLSPIPALLTPCLVRLHQHRLLQREKMWGGGGMEGGKEERVLMS